MESAPITADTKQRLLRASLGRTPQSHRGRALDFIPPVSGGGKGKALEAELPALGCDGLQEGCASGPNEVKNAIRSVLGGGGQPAKLGGEQSLVLGSVSLPPWVGVFFFLPWNSS